MPELKRFQRSITSIPRSYANIPASLLAIAILFAASVVDAVEFHVVDQAGNSLSNAVVTASLEGNSQSQSAGIVSVEQRGQQFNPRVSVVKPGTAVRFPNRDLTQHHVYSFSQARVFEIELYGGEEPSPVIFDQPGIVALGCNIHDWMLGYIYVSPDEHFGVTDQGGRLDMLIDSPAIKTVTIWHPGIKDATPLTLPKHELVVAKNGTLEVVIEIPVGDPLVFEPDPLQSLFEGPGQ